MTRLDLPPSVHPDVLIASGVTYVVLPTVDQGLIISVSSGLMIARNFPPGDWPRLFAHATGILCAYKTSDDNCLTVANVTTGEVTRTDIPAYWNSPICWRDDGLLCVQATNLPIEVWSGMWPELPAPPAVRVGVGTGLAQWEFQRDAPVTWDEINQMYAGIMSQPVVLGTDTPDVSIGQAPQGGIRVTFDQTIGFIAPGTFCNDPRPSLAPDGSLTIVHWVQGSQGTTGTVLYQGVTAADLIVPPPAVLPTIRPFDTAKIVALYPQANGTLTHSSGMNSRIVFGVGLVEFP